jgi:hypothetical protein
MTRTPTHPVTAITIAARAFAWGMFPSGRLSDPRSGTPLSLSH